MAGTAGRYRSRTMLDVRRLRTDLEATKAALARKGVDATVLDVATALDARVRDLATKRDDMRGRIKALSKEVGQAHRQGDEDKAEALAVESRTLGEEERTLAAEAEAA